MHVCALAPAVREPRGDNRFAQDAFEGSALNRLHPRFPDGQLLAGSTSARTPWRCMGGLPSVIAGVVLRYQASFTVALSNSCICPRVRKTLFLGLFSCDHQNAGVCATLPFGKA